MSYRAMMSKIEAVLIKRGNKSKPKPPKGKGLLTPTQSPKMEPDKKSDDVVERLADYIAEIRAIKKELKNGE